MNGTRALAGVVGGFVAAGLMAAVQVATRHWLSTVDTDGAHADSGIGFQGGFRMPEPAAATAQRVLADRALGVHRPVLSSLCVHGAFGASAGLIQAELVPRGTGLALAFGTALWLGATEFALPALRLTKLPRHSSPEIQSFGLLEHLLFAVVVDRIVAASAR